MKYSIFVFHLYFIKIYLGVYEWPTNEYYWLTNDLIQNVYQCSRFPGKCTFSSERQINVKNHEKICTDQQKIESEQVLLGNEKRVMDELIEYTGLTSNMRDYRVTNFIVYDIETLEQSPAEYVDDDEGRNVKACLKLATIATASNIDGDEPRYFERYSSEPEDEQDLVNQFMEHLFELVKKHEKTVPREIREELMDLSMKISKEYKKPKEKRQTKQLMIWNRSKRQLMSFMKLNVYGFNSSKFDLPILLPAIARYCHLNGIKLESMLKKQTGYMSVEVGLLNFKDILGFTSPVRLEKYLKQWNAGEAKSIFPYR